MRTAPLGRTALKIGTFRPISSHNAYTSTPFSASTAVACRCLIALIEPETASTIAVALRNAASVSTLRGVSPSCTMATMRSPERRAASNILSLLALTGADPGTHIPKASTTQCMVFAVAIPAHTPGPRIACSVMSSMRNFPGLPSVAPTDPENRSSMST